jgi:oxygen-dependent protoporphyrinogen oxidase
MLTDAYAVALGPRLRLGAGVSRIERTRKGGFLLEVNGGSVAADALIMAVPAHVSAGLWQQHDAELADELASIAHGPLNLVSFAWRKQQVPRAMDGTGFIVPSTERRATTACSWMSCKWPERAPQGHVLLRSFVQAEGAEDTELVNLARRDLRELMGIEDAPLWVKPKRLRFGLPRYEVGHALRVQRIEARAAAHGELALAGNAFHGVGIPECWHSGKLAARSALTALTGRSPVNRRPPRASELVSGHA